MNRDLRKSIIASLELSIDKKAALFEKYRRSFKAFSNRFSSLAMKSGTPDLARFADTFQFYSDYMTEANPEEFARHYVRQLQQKQRPGGFRDNAKEDVKNKAIHTLRKVVSEILKNKGKDPQFSEFAVQFFDTAANAVSVIAD